MRFIACIAFAWAALTHEVMGAESPVQGEYNLRGIDDHGQGYNMWDNDEYDDDSVISGSEDGDGLLNEAMDEDQIAEYLADRDEWDNVSSDDDEEWIDEHW